MIQVVLGIAVFTGVVLLLVCVILAARARLEPTGEVQIVINQQQTLTVPRGLPSGCNSTIPPQTFASIKFYATS